MPSNADLYSTGAWQAVRRYVLQRDHYQCQVHGPRCTQYATDADHVVALADGGAMFDTHNLRASCKRCNGGRAAQRTNAMRRAARYRTGVPTYDTRL